MDKNLGDYMADLKDDVAEFRKRRARISEDLASLSKTLPSGTVLSASFELDANLHRMFEMVKIIFSNIMGEDYSDDELVGYLVSRGLILEMAKFSKVRELLYSTADFGEMEAAAMLPDEEKRIAELTPPRIDAMVEKAKLGNTMEDLWNIGYTTTRCPWCRKVAGWNEELGHLVCLSCGKQGDFKSRPGPDDVVD